MLKCKRCLLLEAGEHNAYKTISDYIANLDDDLKADDFTYKSRLDKCKNCDELIAGMCRKCGCYVEARAIFKDKSCANFDDIKW